MMKNSIFIHAAILDKCKERVLQYLDIIYNSNLINNVVNVYICFVGPENIPINYNDITKYNVNNNIKLLKVSENLQDYEVRTLNFLYSFCIENTECNVLYLHTKNVGKEINVCIEDQIVYMLYFLIEKWNNCLDKLADYETCGVDLRTTPTLHYSGNFWWSRASNIISLPSPIDFNNLIKYPNPLNSIRHNHEFWVCYNKKSECYFSLWDCGINVYERHLHRYPRELYINP
jgi:hypothetical protein